MENLDLFLFVVQRDLNRKQTNIIKIFEPGALVDGDGVWGFCGC